MLWIFSRKLEKTLVWLAVLVTIKSLPRTGALSQKLPTDVDTLLISDSLQGLPPFPSNNNVWTLDTTPRKSNSSPQKIDGGKMLLGWPLFIGITCSRWRSAYDSIQSSWIIMSPPCDPVSFCFPSLASTNLDWIWVCLKIRAPLNSSNWDSYSMKQLANLCIWKGHNFARQISRVPTFRCHFLGLTLQCVVPQQLQKQGLTWQRTHSRNSGALVLFDGVGKPR